MKKLIPILLILFALPAFVGAQATSEIEAVVIEVINDQQIIAQDFSGNEYEALLSSTKTDGYDYNLKAADKVYLQIIEFSDNTEQIYFGDVNRLAGLWWIFIIFAILAIAIGRRGGLFALVGLMVTIAILFGWVFPKIIAGADPVLIVILGAVVILGVNMHLTHGFRKATFIAFLSTVVGLVFVLIFSYLFVSLGSLTGLATEDAVMLFAGASGLIIPKGILLVGIILGAVGVLDDIAITQQETVFEIGSADPSLDKKELFKRAMNVGRHHIASVINTLVLAYVGVALPLFLIFMMNDTISITRFLNEEFVAEEIIRTLAGTLALILTVPIATWFAILIRKR